MMTAEANEAISGKSTPIYLCGHGRHELNSSYFTVPKGTSIAFYGHYLRPIPHLLVLDILAGRVKANPERVIEQHMSCPDMNLYEDDEPLLKESSEALAANPASPAGVIISVNDMKLRMPLLAQGEMGKERHYVKLSRICQEFPESNFVWLACSSTDLRCIGYEEVPAGLYTAPTKVRSNPLHSVYHPDKEAEKNADLFENFRSGNRNQAQVEFYRTESLEEFQASKKIADRTQAVAQFEAYKTRQKERYEKMIANAVKAPRYHATVK